MKNKIKLLLIFILTIWIFWISNWITQTELNTSKSEVEKLQGGNIYILACDVIVWAKKWDKTKLDTLVANIKVATDYIASKYSSHKKEPYLTKVLTYFKNKALYVKGNWITASTGDNIIDYDWTVDVWNNWKRMFIYCSASSL